MTAKVSDLSYKVVSEGIQPGCADERGALRTGEIYAVIIEVNGAVYALKLMMPMGVTADRDRITSVMASVCHALDIVGFLPAEKVKLDG